jgi:nucleoside diphosphate kinase
MSFITSGPVLAMELKAESAVTRWRSLLGMSKIEPCMLNKSNFVTFHVTKNKTANS